MPHTPLSQPRRRLLQILAALGASQVLFTPHGAWASNHAVNLPEPHENQDRQATLTLSGPPATVTLPLLHMVATNPLSDIADTLVFKPWRDPDQLRAIAVEQSADFIAVPTNVAANLYNRGIPLALLNVSVWGMLALVSRSPDRHTLADFKGEEIAMPFRADMPDILFQLLARAQGLDPQHDFKLRYVASPMDAAQLLITRRVDHALLGEPAVSMVLQKSQSFPTSVIAPDLFRSVDLQQEWGRVLQREPRIPQAGVAALGTASRDAALLARFQQAYAASHAWCAANPEACGQLAEQYIDLLKADAVADALRHTPQHLASAAQARPELEYFYQLLLDQNPQLIGGRLPEDDFYIGIQTAIE